MADENDTGLKSAEPIVLSSRVYHQPTHLLSKSTFMRGTQCPKSLWLYKNSPHLQDDLSPAQEAIFAQGSRVGQLAQGLFPDGVDLSPDYVDGLPRFAGALARTAEAIRDGQVVLYEAAFVHDDVLAAVDLMVRDGDRWRVYEVKSGTSAKETYRADAALQYFVLRGAGLDILDISIVHIDNRYVRQGDIDVHKLFAIKSVREFAEAERKKIGHKVAGLKDIVRLKVAPEVPIGPYCSEPYRCSFTGHCWARVPERSVFSISHLGKRAWDLYKRGIVNVADIPNDFRLNQTQRIEVTCERTDKPHIDVKAVRSFLKQLDGPLEFLDFETMGPAVPLFEGTHPFQAIPFQYSLHKRNARGQKLEHTAFLGDGRTDPRSALIDQLLADTEGEAPILMYSPYEKRMLKELAKHNPKRAKELTQRMERLVDLITPFRSHDYYTAEMCGSSSIKNVLPALVPELSYDGMEIADGNAASGAYESLYYDRNPERIAHIRKALLDYCKLDTLAMVRILEVLERALNEY